LTNTRLPPHLASLNARLHTADGNSRHHTDGITSVHVTHRLLPLFNLREMTFGIPFVNILLNLEYIIQTRFVRLSSVILILAVLLNLVKS